MLVEAQYSMPTCSSPRLQRRSFLVPRYVIRPIVRRGSLPRGRWSGPTSYSSVATHAYLSHWSLPLPHRRDLQNRPGGRSSGNARYTSVWR